jgi:hypothetical protein
MQCVIKVIPTLDKYHLNTGGLTCIFVAQTIDFQILICVP